ncbi:MULTISPECIES: type II toxin-antitoxin system RelB family antitoxin [Serratia]|uniref:type II toxin-antitoxin system RelB family antitoxin n=1 Tax=Serratia TaxID=613 RepID=UPI0036D2DE77
MITKLSLIVSEFETQERVDSYDSWFRAKVQAALDEPRPGIPHDEAMAEIIDYIDQYNPAASRKLHSQIVHASRICLSTLIFIALAGGLVHGKLLFTLTILLFTMSMSCKWRFYVCYILTGNILKSYKERSK